jgi:translation initiation factor IF-3
LLCLQDGGPRATEKDYGGELPISSTEYRLNDRIRAAKCRLIGFDGSQLGIFAMSDALRIADEQGFDLVEIAPTADPPVCKIMDFGKFKYEQSMKDKAARKNQSKIELKDQEEAHPALLGRRGEGQGHDHVPWP